MFSASKPWAAIDISSSISQNGLKIGSKRPVISFSTRTESVRAVRNRREDDARALEDGSLQPADDAELRPGVDVVEVVDEDHDVAVAREGAERKLIGWPSSGERLSLPGGGLRAPRLLDRGVRDQGSADLRAPLVVLPVPLGALARLLLIGPERVRERLPEGPGRIDVSARNPDCVRYDAPHEHGLPRLRRPPRARGSGAVRPGSSRAPSPGEVRRAGRT